jgi:hypothetical protein
MCTCTIRWWMQQRKTSTYHGINRASASNHRSCKQICIRASASDDHIFSRVRPTDGDRICAPHMRGGRERRAPINISFITMHGRGPFRHFSNKISPHRSLAMASKSSAMLLATILVLAVASAHPRPSRRRREHPAAYTPALRFTRVNTFYFPLSFRNPAASFFPSSLPSCPFWSRSFQIPTITSAEQYENDGTSEMAVTFFFWRKAVTIYQRKQLLDEWNNTSSLI